MEQSPSIPPCDPLEIGDYSLAKPNGFLVEDGCLLAQVNVIVECVVVELGVRHACTRGEWRRGLLQIDQLI